MLELLDESLAEEQAVPLWPLGEELLYSGTPNEFVRALPHYGKVPKGRREQIKWRNELAKACDNSPSSQRRIISMCREDVLFWINSFVLLYEPRNRKQTTIPFNSWPHQDDVIAAIDRYLGVRDVGVNKSRGEGCSWLVLMIFLHRWLFDSKTSFGSYGLVSLNEDLVDDAKNPDSLMWKLDWEINHLPRWMLPKGFSWREHRSRADHTLLNPETGATIKGFACTQNVASGGRKTAFLMDELAKWPRPQDSVAMTSTQHVTNSRIIVSTPFGNEGAYYDSLHEPSSLLKLTMHWTYNPVRRRGLYYWDLKRDRLQRLDVDYEHGVDYPFVKDGKKRSPWYDAECRRPKATPRSIAQDLDLNFEQSVELFFEPLVMDLVKESVRGPLAVGRVWSDAYGSPARWVDDSKGDVRIWVPLVDGRLPPDKYTMGIDIAEGTGSDWSSNSSIEVFSMTSGEQVLECANNYTSPEDWAQLCVAIARWLQGEGGFPPYLTWESSGAGGRFGQQIELLGYRHVYLRRPQNQLKAYLKKRAGYKNAVPTAGYFNKNKAESFTHLQVAIKLRRLIVRSQEAALEMPEFRHIPGGKVEHFRAVTTENESTKGMLHGDRVSGMAMAVVGMNDFMNLRRPTESASAQAPRPVRWERVLASVQEENWDESVFE